MTPRTRKIAEECFHGFHDGIEPDYIGRIEFRIEQALIQYGKEIREETIKKCAAIAQDFVDHPYTSDTMNECENLREDILKLLKSEEK